MTINAGLNILRIGSSCTFVVLLTICMATGLNTAAALQLGPPDGVDGVEVLTRGPIHEAFAETVTFDPEPGFVAPKAPPAPIEELPPEQRPEGANVGWIPGYWAWDDERSDFLWVSGIWRAVPPARQWVSGYWGKSGRDSQWTSGYWADAKASEVEYLPEPPDTVEAGPNTAAPSADHSWVPGSWVWHQSRYVWRPGYWATAQADWVWVPSHYVWAPRGYVFVDGYWDYSVARRGVLFAPVYFDPGVYSRRDFRFSPATVISLSVFADHLFSRPRYHHYYFGDYYGTSYQTAGYYPSYSSQSRRHGYDPIYAHQRWQHRQDREWEHRVEAQFQHRRDHENARPPRTWAAQRALGPSAVGSNAASFVVAAPLDQFALNKDGRIRFQAVGQEERQRLVRHGQEIQAFRQERQNLETRGVTSNTDPAKRGEPARMKLPRSPIFAKSAAELGRNHTPPQTHVAPPPDPKFAPKPRVARSSAQPRTQTTNRLPVDVIRPQPVVPRQLQPTLNQSAAQQQVQPRVNQPASQPQPRGNRAAKSQLQPNGNPSSEPQTQRKVNRSALQPQIPPRVNQPVSQSPPRVDRAAKSQPQSPTKQLHPQSAVDRPPAQSRGNPAAPPRRSAGPQPDKHNLQGKK